jgi:hypothetical protein
VQAAEVEVEVVEVEVVEVEVEGGGGGEAGGAGDAAAEMFRSAATTAHAVSRAATSGCDSGSTTDGIGDATSWLGCGSSGCTSAPGHTNTT